MIYRYETGGISKMKSDGSQSNCGTSSVFAPWFSGVLGGHGQTLRNAACAAVVITGCTFAVQAQERDPMLFHDANGLTVRGHLQFGLNAVSEDNLFWDLAATTAPGSGFDPDTD